MQVSYRSYWTRVILEALRDHRANMSIKDISEATAVRCVRVVSCMTSMRWWVCIALHASPCSGGAAAA